MKKYDFGGFYTCHLFWFLKHFVFHFWWILNLPSISLSPPGTAASASLSEQVNFDMKKLFLGLDLNSNLYLKEVLDNLFQQDTLCQHLVQLDQVTVHQNLPECLLSDTKNDTANPIPNQKKARLAHLRIRRISSGKASAPPSSSITFSST